jgi:hypothetical protein
MKLSFKYCPSRELEFGKTYTIKLPRTGELWECVVLMEDEIDEINEKIRNLLRVADSFKKIKSLNS